MPGRCRTGRRARALGQRLSYCMLLARRGGHSATATASTCSSRRPQTSGRRPGSRRAGFRRRSAQARTAEHEHPALAPSGGQGAADLVAVHARQVAVQHDHVVAVDSGTVQGGLAIPRTSTATPSPRSTSTTVSASSWLSWTSRTLITVSPWRACDRLTPGGQRAQRSGSRTWSGSRCRTVLMEV